MSWKETAGMIRNKPFVVGLTGGIATGKSTAAAMIRDYGFQVIDADEIARYILEPGKPGSLLVSGEFPMVMDESGEIDRKKLGDIIFSDSTLREKLDSMLHPLISNEILRRLELLKSELVVFIDIPLLFEVKGKMEEEGVEFNEIWLVYVNRETQFNRLIKRNRLSDSDARRRINSQMDIEQKRQLSDVVIDNMGSKEHLNKQLGVLLDQMDIRIKSMYYSECKDMDSKDGKDEKNRY